MTPLTDLLRRVEGATGSSMDIDTAILRHLGFTWRGMNYWSADDKTMWTGPVRFTASFDAALALVELALPGAEYEITNLYGVALVRLPMNFSLTLEEQCARREDGNMPLAIVAALLRALIARQGSSQSSVPARC